MTKVSHRKAIELPYYSRNSTSPISQKKEILYEPRILVDVGYNGKFFRVLCKQARPTLLGFIDSGSDHTLADYDVGKAIGVPFRKTKSFPIGGISGNKIDAYFASVHLVVEGRTYPTHVGFVKNFATDVLLGGIGFFDHWKVRFEYPKCIELEWIH